MSDELVVAGALLSSRLGGASEQRLRIVLVDRGASAQRARLLSRHPHLAVYCEIVAVDLEPAMVVFERPDLLRGSAGPMRAYVCMDDPVAGLSTGVQLYRTIGRQKAVVIAVLSEEDSAGRFLAPGGVFDVGLQLFGLIERTCTVELLLDTPVEAVARLQHLDHVRERLAAGLNLGDTPFLRPWEQLTEAQKDENREWARSVPAKLRGIGELRELRDWEHPLFAFTGDETEVLAEREHERWLTWRLETGWRHASDRNDDLQLHPDLVSWDELSERSREYDRSQIRNLPRQLARAGYEIYRLDHDADGVARTTATTALR
jgi:hypothetical protein